MNRKLYSAIIIFYFLNVCTCFSNIVINQDKQSMVKDECSLKLYDFLKQSALRLETDHDSIIYIIDKLRDMSDVTDDVFCKSLIDYYTAYALFSDYNSNQYSINSRTNLSGEAPKNIREWSSNNYVEEIMKYLSSSIKEPQILKGHNTSEIKMLLDNNTEYENTDYYSFILKRAIALAKELHYQGIFSRNIEDASFYEKCTLPYNEFEKAEISQINTIPQHFAAGAYQSLLKYYKSNNLSNDFILANIERLNFFNYSNKYEASIIKELKSYIETTKDESSLIAAAEYVDLELNTINNKYGFLDADIPLKSDIETINSYLNIPCIKEARENKYIELKKLLDFSKALIDKYPSSGYSAMLKNSREKIREGFSFFRLQNKYPANKPVSGLLKYKNLKDVNISIYNSTVQENIFEKNIFLSDTLSLIDQFKSISLPQISFGEYSIEIDKSKQNFFISNLLSFQKTVNGVLSFYVVNKTTGFPEKNAKISIYNDRSKNENPVKEIYTNKDGIAETKGDELPTSIYYKVSKGDDKYSKKAYIYSRRDCQPVGGEIVTLFTDRGLYRPGQKIYFKGIVWERGETSNRVIGNHTVEVTLDRADGVNITNQNFKSDNFGGFAGEFVIPNDIKNGTIYLKSNKEFKTVEVAEYKRPEFEISFEKINDIYVYGDSVKVNGNVKTLSGFDLENCGVEYSIHQRELFNRFSSYEDIISTGIVKTNKKGNFEFSFLAKEPLRNSYFEFSNFVVDVKVTSPSGEIQNSTQNISIGKSSVYTLITINKQSNVFTNISTKESIHFIDKTSSDSIKISSKNLNDEPFNGKGTMYIYKTDFQKISISCCNQAEESDLIKTIEFDTNKEFAFDFKSLNKGFYILKAAVTDSKGYKSERKLTIYIFSNDKKIDSRFKEWISIPKEKLYVGEKQNIEVGTSMKNVYAVYTVYYKGSSERQNFILNNERKSIPFEYKEIYGSNCRIEIIFVKDGEVYNQRFTINKIKENDGLTITTETFRDKISAGEKETWSFTVKDNKGNGMQSQLLADMYDASLDMINSFNWSIPFAVNNVFYTDSYSSFYESNIYIRNFYNGQRYQEKSINSPIFNSFGLGGNRFETLATKSFKSNVSSIANDSELQTVVGFGAKKKEYMVGAIAGAYPGAIVEHVINEEEISDKDAAANNSNISIRENFDETAFFYPLLNTNEKGEVKFSFVMPQSLTQWRFMALATTEDLNFGFISKKVVTTKEFMIMPTLPRFVRTGDNVMISFIIMNNTDKTQTGTSSIEMFLPENDSVWFENKTSFNVEKNGSQTVSFNVDIPQNISITGIRLKAYNESFSDGEQHVIAVLPSRSLVTQSMNMNVTGKGENKFVFKDFVNNKSKSLSNLRYTVEFTGNPSWYAVNALSAQRGKINNNIVSEAGCNFFVNTLSCYIAQSNPEIKKYIDNIDLNDKSSIESTLEKNQQLKELVLSQTPWVVNAETEKNNLRSLSSLFDINRNTNLQRESLELIRSLQNKDGGFSWYKDWDSNLFETLNILAVFSRLRDLGALETSEVLGDIEIRAVNYSDKEVENYRVESTKGKTDADYVPRYSDILWAMTRGFYMDIPFNYGSSYTHKKIINYIKENWKNLSLYEKAVSSITLNKYGFKDEADLINKYLLRISTTSKEMGRYWANNNSSLFNRVNPLRTHVMIMQALSLNGENVELMNELKTWLLREKQVQQWESYIATIDAVYAILNTGSDWLSSKDLPIVKVGDITLETKGYLAACDTAFNTNDIRKEYGTITVTRDSDHPAFGAAYWQYFEDFSKIKSNFTGLKIKKELYREVKSTSGTTLEPTDGVINQGDIIVTRIVVTADRDYEYVTLTDQRAACFEPYEQLSGYKYNQGVGYFSEIKDAATNFFFNWVPKGTFVFEYKVKAQIKGEFNDGISKIQCYYAPQFTGNSQGSKVRVE
ncbi:MAG: alpha-2-macroglobulin family protein [Bacteroidales bacterium]|nr:alpha-2-macroglobulin family protein [Bacteroidales bacterium]